MAIGSGCASAFARPEQLRSPFPETAATDGATIERRERLGGLLSYYHRKAA